MARPLCDCGYTRTDYGDGLIVCRHCDLGECQNPNSCSRCRTYTLAVGKRVAA